MRTIQINTESYKKMEDGNYRVYLGNSLFYFYPSKREAERFIAETNRFLTQTAFSINQLYIDLFTMYRELWPLMRDSKSKYPGTLIQLDRNCKQSLESAEVVLSKAFELSAHENGNAWSFTNLYKALAFLKGTAFEIKGFTVSKGQLQSTYKANDMLNRMATYKAEMERWGQDDKTGALRIELNLEAIEGQEQNILKMTA